MAPIPEITTTAKVGESGRITLDKSDREALGIDGKESYAKITVEPLSIEGTPVDELVVEE